MEQGFDFSILRWIFIIGAVVLINFFNKKPKVTAQEGDQDGSADGGKVGDEPTMKKFEELFGELFEKPQGGVEPQVEPVKEARQRVTPTPTTHPAKRLTSPTESRVNQDDLSLSEIGSESGDSEAIVENFDLREAVIMSEILKRKYEE
ncbi:MAG: hypothetical protein SNG49_01970 [Rikenellaceae bacterium]